MNTEQLIKQLVEEGAQEALPHPMKQTIKWLLVALLYLGGVSLFFGFRADIAVQLSTVSIDLELLFLLAMAVSAALAAFCLSRPDGHQMPWIKYIPFAFLLPWAITAFAGSAGDLQLANILHEMTLNQFGCPWHILLFSVPPGIVMFLALRKGATIRCCWAGLMAAWSVSAFAYMLMRLFEQNDDPAHLLVWHVFPIVLICIAGMMIGKFALRWR